MSGLPSGGETDLAKQVNEKGSGVKVVEVMKKRTIVSKVKSSREGQKRRREEGGGPSSIRGGPWKSPRRFKSCTRHVQNRGGFQWCGNAPFKGGSPFRNLADLHWPRDI